MPKKRKIDPRLYEIKKDFDGPVDDETIDEIEEMSRQLDGSCILDENER